MSYVPKQGKQKADSMVESGDDATRWVKAAQAGTIRPRARPDVTVTDIDDEIILYDPSDGSTHALNLTGALVWDLCDGTRTLEEIADTVADDFGRPREQTRPDVEALAARLYALGLITGEAIADSDRRDKITDSDRRDKITDSDQQ